MVAKTTVTDITTVAIPANSTAPRYRGINIDAITVDTSLSSQCGSGVLADPDGTVRALWLTYLGDRAPGGKDVEYHLGLAAASVLPVVHQVQAGALPRLRYLNVELHLVHMSQARIMGASEEWIRRVEADNPERHQLFMVRKVECAAPPTAAAAAQATAPAPAAADHAPAAAASPAAAAAAALAPAPVPAANANQPQLQLLEGDLILSVNGKVMTRVTELDAMYDHATLDLAIVRGCREMRLTVPTLPTDCLETDRVVICCGAVLHRPHHAVRQQISRLHSDVYVSARTRGSPAFQYQLVPTNFILAVNGIATPDLDAFLAEVSRIPDNTYFRLRVITFDNVPFVISIKKNEHYVCGPSGGTVGGGGGGGG